MKVKSITGVKNLSGKRVLVRADFNVPFKGNKIKEIYKIEQSLPTVKLLIKAGAKVVLASHLGRPKGVDKSLSLKPVVNELKKLLGKDVSFLNFGDGEVDSAEKLKKFNNKINVLPKGSVTLLENIRFIKGEDDCAPRVAKALAKIADVFVIDGFAVAHRKAASVSGVAEYLPSYAGLLLETELKGLNALMAKPRKPFVVVLGGAKMETKTPLIKKLLPKASQILLGGGLANTCFWAKGYKVGGSLIDKADKKIALSYLKNKKIILPVDVVVGRADGKNARVLETGQDFRIVDNKNAIFDIGPKTISLYSKYLKKANTLVWNGAMGMFEQRPYQWGSNAIARLFAARARGPAFGVSGGGETVEIIKKLKLMNEIDLVSTGGGAMLELLSGKKLPGVAAVSKK